MGTAVTFWQWLALFWSFVALAIGLPGLYARWQAGRASSLRLELMREEHHRALENARAAFRSEGER